MKNILVLLLTSLTLASCTQTMTMVHTQGQADDVVDETSAASPTVTPTINVPITPGAGLGLIK